MSFFLLDMVKLVFVVIHRTKRKPHRSLIFQIYTVNCIKKNFLLKNKDFHRYLSTCKAIDFTIILLLKIIIYMTCITDKRYKIVEKPN